MKKTAAWLAVYAMEQLGIKFTFGIPGVHNTELYDELNNSQSVTPVLVTHEGGAAFMADGVSRAAGDTIGALAIVPAAGFTHAASGIGEAFLDGIPMLIFSGGIRTDTGKRYQLHEIDQMELAKPLTKAAFRVLRHEDVVPTIFEAYRIATGGEPGPVLIEIPVNLQLFPGEVGELPRWQAQPVQQAPERAVIRRAADMLLGAQKTGLFVGWGARAATDELVAIAELLQAPVSTTLQGLSTFPGDHPLHAGFGFSPSAVPAARNAFKDCDAMLAVGTHFGEIPTGSFSAVVPRNLVHVDINPDVFDANYPGAVNIAGDAKATLAALLAELKARGPRAANTELRAQIARDKRAYREEWYAHDSKGRVNPARFFDELRRQMPDDAVTVLDDGNHTFLTAELFPIHPGGRLLTPTDFNAMGYAVPAAIGAKLAQPDMEVFAIVGDGCFMMTCMEIVTAAANRLGVIYFVFHDGELSQIAQAQQIPYNRKPCTVLAGPNIEGIALATGAAYVAMPDEKAIAGAISEARRIAAGGRPVIVDVAIDYSKRTAFTSGTAKSTFKRFPLSQRVRFAGRALMRKVTG
ncbi:thiamine pyrophosphate-binding protein [Noviherbaspirillum autotrophicum]|uniref:Acetolactate synthase large subunit n=1 Tax=Noviherbaspirillum autotrophicum TaxID=709839 RepID=A0A0C2BJX2_9BURK|nr:thiamine pyrophosphate-binding protein [Noviherbaspirillum autotrophicum]KIF81515.1 acetolactate synthase large subunit [Noviherbaspirillum autotrophicum]